MGWKVTRPSDIYAIQCKENGRVYIGRTYDLKRRIKEHFQMLRNCKKTRYVHKTSCLSEFQKDYNKYGEEAFEVYVIESSVPPEKCDEREAFWIAEYNATDPRFGYNFRDERLKSVDIRITHGAPPKIIELDK
jgi:group I intron endonuclease